MKKNLIALFVLVIVLLVSLATADAFAQVVPIDLGPGDGDGNETPIGGLALLAALGGGYAIKKLRDEKRQT